MPGGSTNSSRICKHCGIRRVAHKGNGKYRDICNDCNKKPYRRRVYTDGIKCEKCGFIPEHFCQIDIDHIDGNHDNNSASNLMALCANCHRLKTYKEKDWMPKRVCENSCETLGMLLFE